ncbi:hypothetical protein EHS25_004793 [Saitozyma podzolica]|uniref:Major facilitator superfamily (MFS) profile domain-containing protein n=1 Tax=Saitozyma podzolica TaxID=1890683 RepID=A0A427Y2T8_9TREE|nr:hypothetical protein EHS25_004793 [Saitozyma podzolica]
MHRVQLFPVRCTVCQSRAVHGVPIPVRLLTTTTTNPERVEAPVTFKAYLRCVFASFGGIFFGYDSGYMNGVLGMNYFISLHTGLPIPSANATAAETASFAPPAWQKSLITSVFRRTDSGSYRIPIAIQFLWALILGTGLTFLPETPRWYVKKGRVDAATRSLSRICGQPGDSTFIQEELAEILANNEYEQEMIPTTNYFNSWLACFTGGLRNPGSNLRRTILGTSLQMMQQWTGVNFIFYFGTTFFQSLSTISNPFLMSLITTLVNVCSTPLSFWTIERFGRGPLLIWGALGMLICEFICAIIGVSRGSDPSAVKAQISFICINGEIFPLPIRSRGVALSTASNWLWNCIITVITPYTVSTDKGNLGSRVFFIWGSTCILCFFYAYFLVCETKGLTLEQVDRMMEEVRNAIKSAGWKPHSTFAADMGLNKSGKPLSRPM